MTDDKQALAGHLLDVLQNYNPEFVRGYMITILTDLDDETLQKHHVYLNSHYIKTSFA